jgi:hypothetical protein
LKENYQKVRKAQNQKCRKQKTYNSGEKKVWRHAVILFAKYVASQWLRSDTQNVMKVAFLKLHTENYLLCS